MDVGGSYSDMAAMFSGVPLGWLVILGLVVLLSLDAMRSGLSRAVAISISLPIAFFLQNLLQQAVFLGPLLGSSESSVVKVVVAGGLLLVVFILVYRMVDTYSTDAYGSLQAVLTGIATTIVLVILWTLISPLNTLWDFGPSVQSSFSESYRFWWLLVAYIAIAFARS